METLRLLTILLFIAASNISIHGQNGKKLIDAFSQSYKYEAEGNYTKAIEAIRSEYDESSYPVNLRLGWLSYLNGSFIESASYYNRAIQLMPMSIEARLGFALPASAMGNWDHVISRYLEILKIDPNHYLTNYRLGVIYYNRDDYSTAYKYLERIVNLYPFDFDAIHIFAWVNLRMGKKKEAFSLFQRALLIKPGDSSALEGWNLSNQ